MKRDATVVPGIDPVTFEVLRMGLDTIADEMAYTIVRSARSTMIKDCMDYSASLCTAHGDLIAQAVNIPVMMCSTPDALLPTIRKLGPTLAPGDCIILSDPYEGGSHLPDIFMFVPIFWDGRLVAFSSTCAHHADVGGMVPGSGSSDATEIFQEGLRIPIVKLYEGGKPNAALYELILRNVRFPSMLEGDLEAQRSACLIGERELHRLIGRYGVDTVVNGMAALLDYSERIVREEIRAMPDGVYEFTDYVDEDGMDPDPIPIRLSLEIRGDRVIADFSAIGATGARLDQLFAVGDQGVDVHGDKVLLPAAVPAELRVLPSDRGDRTRRHRSQRRVSRCDLHARPHDLPDQQRPVRSAGARHARAGDRCGRGRYLHRRDGRPRCGQRALPVHGDDLRRVGRARGCRRDRLRIECDGVAVEHAGRGARDRVPGRHGPVRVRAGLGRGRPLPWRAVACARVPLSRRSRHAADARGPGAVRAVRAVRRATRRAERRTGSTRTARTSSSPPR